jgi:hypothetical protein
MKREMELIRELLLALETAPVVRAQEQFKIEGYTQEQVNYHAGLLIEAGLAEGKGMCKLGDPVTKYTLHRLTWSGHEFLDAARDDRRWKTAMAKVVEMGGTVTIGVLQSVLVGVMKAQFGI